MKRWLRWLIAVSFAIGVFALWAPSQIRGQLRDDDLKARVEALEKRVRELEQRLNRLERQHLRPFFFSPFPPPSVIVPPVPFGVPPMERGAPRFGEPRPAPNPFVQPYYYPSMPE